MGISLSVFVIEITIVSACCHSLVGDVYYRLNLLVDVERVFGGLGDTYLPWQTFLVDSTGDYLAAYLYHIVVYILATEILGYYVASVALGD